MTFDIFLLISTDIRELYMENVTKIRVELAGILRLKNLQNMGRQLPGPYSLLSTVVPADSYLINHRNYIRILCGPLYGMFYSNVARKTCSEV